jgi:hypothetical protein
LAVSWNSKFFRIAPWFSAIHCPVNTKISLLLPAHPARSYGIHLGSLYARIINIAPKIPLIKANKPKNSTSANIIPCPYRIRSTRAETETKPAPKASNRNTAPIIPKIIETILDSCIFIVDPSLSGPAFLAVDSAWEQYKLKARKTT